LSNCLFSTTFNFLDFGYGSAISYVVMILSGIFGYFYVRNMAYEKLMKHRRNISIGRLKIEKL